MFNPQMFQSFLKHLLPERQLKMMTNNNDSLHLIKGQFSPSEAKEILLSLFDYKIQFHQLQLLSMRERGMDAYLHSKERLEELKSNRDKIVALTSMCGELGEQINLEAEVVLSISVGPKVHG